jgi:hypothetical protein
VGTQLATWTFATPVELQPDTNYWMNLSDGAGTASWYVAPLGKYEGLVTRGAGASTAGSIFEFTLFGRQSDLGTSFVRFDDGSFADDSDQIVIDGVTIYLSSTETPYVSLKARQAQYRFTPATLYNETTGQSITINAACAVGAQLDIDIGAGTAVNVDDEDGTSFASGLEYSDPDAKFTLAPGANSLRFVEAGMVGVNVEAAGYARWE